MLLREFDRKKYERSIRNDGKEEGREEGRAEGRAEGIAVGIRQQQEETIRKLHAKGMTGQEIVELLEIPAERVRAVIDF